MYFGAGIDNCQFDYFNVKLNILHNISTEEMAAPQLQQN